MPECTFCLKPIEQDEEYRDVAVYGNGHSKAHSECYEENLAVVRRVKMAVKARADAAKPAKKTVVVKKTVQCVDCGTPLSNPQAYRCRKCASAERVQFRAAMGA